MDENGLPPLPPLEGMPGAMNGFDLPPDISSLLQAGDLPQAFAAPAQWLAPGPPVMGGEQFGAAQQHAGMAQQLPPLPLPPALGGGAGGAAQDGGGGGGWASLEAEAGGLGVPLAVGTGSRLDPATMAAKLATAREKNRLAQQRFRERQRAKQREADDQAAELQKELDDLRSENEQLDRQNRIFEKVLAVRDAMAHAFASLHAGRGEQQQQQQQQQPQEGQQAAREQAPAPAPLDAPPSPAATAAQHLARALDELPTEQEMEKAAEAAWAAGGESAPQRPPPSPQREMEAALAARARGMSLGQVQEALEHAQANQQREQQQPQVPAVKEEQQEEQQEQPAAALLDSAAAGEGEEGPAGSSPQPGAAGEPAVEPAGGEPPAEVPPPDKPGQSLLASAHRSGAASQLDGSVLRQVPSIPLPNDQLVRAMVMDMMEPEHLLDYYRQWQAELSVSVMAAEAAGFDEDSVAEVVALQERMAKVWWHVSEVRPNYLCFLAHAALPEHSGTFPLWRDIAARLLPELDENSRAILRRAWYGYSKRVAKVAVRASRWVKRLQQFTIQPLRSLSTHASSSLELQEITEKLSEAMQEEYVASMEFIAEQAYATTDLQKAMMNRDAGPWMPDVVAIVWNLLCIDSQERRVQTAQAKEATSSPTAAATQAAAAAGAAAGGPQAPGQ